MPNIAEVSLVYKASQSVETLPNITSPQEAAEYLRSIWDDDKLELQEEFVVVLLDFSKHVLGWSIVSSGGQTATIVEPSAVFQLALLVKADSILCCQLPPERKFKGEQCGYFSDDPSNERRKVTGLTLDDHITLTRGGYLSLRKEGLF